MEKPWSEIMRWLAAAVGAVVGLFMQMPTAVRLLMLLMVLDYFGGSGQKQKERHRRIEQQSRFHRAGAQGDDFGHCAAGGCAGPRDGQRGVYGRGNAVLYRQRIAVHSGKRGAARCADSGKAQADAGYSEKRKRDGSRRKPENLRHTA